MKEVNIQLGCRVYENEEFVESYFLFQGSYMTFKGIVLIGTFSCLYRLILS